MSQGQGLHELSFTAGESSDLPISECSLILPVRILNPRNIVIAPTLVLNNILSVFLEIIYFVLYPVISPSVSLRRSVFNSLLLHF